MEKYFKNITLIMITHHIHMVKNCKKIIVVDQGRIVESGEYEALLKNKRSYFYSLYEESRNM
jgi:ABC-type multidrug transport system fused ATPase/permease subunit